jgi:hypothetical protein
MSLFRSLSEYLGSILRRNKNTQTKVYHFRRGDTMADWKPGEVFIPRDTTLIKNCGIDPSRGRGHVTYVADGFISFYLDRGPSGAGWIEARCSLETFGLNFLHLPVREISKAYITSRHFTKLFPANYEFPARAGFAGAGRRG